MYSSKFVPSMGMLKTSSAKVVNRNARHILNCYLSCMTYFGDSWSQVEIKVFVIAWVVIGLRPCMLRALYLDLLIRSEYCYNWSYYGSYVLNIIMTNHIITRMFLIVLWLCKWNSQFVPPPKNSVMIDQIIAHVFSILSWLSCYRLLVLNIATIDDIIAHIVILEAFILISWTFIF